MGDEDSVIKSIATSLFIQFESGKETYYLGKCTSLDSIDNSRGGSDPIICRNGIDGFEIISDKPSPPDMISFTIERLHAKTASWLDKTNCPFTLFALQRCEGSEGIFENWITGQSVRRCRITNDPIGNVQQRDAADEMTHSYEVTGRPPRYDYYEMLTSGRSTAAAVADATAITSCDDIICSDGCGQAVTTPCLNIFIGLETVAAAAPNMQHSHDSGNSWVSAAGPFEANTSFAALKCYKLDADTLRIIAFRGTLAATANKMGYSDDMGTTWSALITVDSTVASAVVSPNALFIFSGTAMWVGLDDGKIYSSDDGGVTWTEQASAVVADAGNDIMGIDFFSETFGVAVGAGDSVIYTTDGGVNWAAAAATGAAGILNDVEILSRMHWIVAAANGRTYVTYDGGTTWTAMNNFSGAGAGSVKSLDFADEQNGFMVHQTAGGVGRIFRTINGGYSWILVGPNYPAAGLNEVIACEVNAAFAVGDDDGTRPVVIGAGIL
jgi:photosystem II stability/assembly factor-like uncharacterized protein